MKLILAFFLFQALRPINYTDPLDRMPTHYKEYVSMRVMVPFSYKVVKPMETTRAELIVTIVNDSLYMVFLTCYQRLF